MSAHEGTLAKTHRVRQTQRHTQHTNSSTSGELFTIDATIPSSCHSTRLANKRKTHPQTQKDTAKKHVRKLMKFPNENSILALGRAHINCELKKSTHTRMCRGLSCKLSMINDPGGAHRARVHKYLAQLRHKQRRQQQQQHSYSLVMCLCVVKRMKTHVCTR